MDHIGHQHAVGAEYSRRGRQQHRWNAEGCGQIAGVERAGSAEGEEGIVRGIGAVPDRDRANRVGHLFGGDGRFPTKVEGREFTHTEQRVIRRMLKLALEGYSDAWKAIYPLDVEYVRSEMQVKFTNITTSPNDIVVNTPFQVEIGNLVGEFNICIPFSMIEPLRELLVNPPLENSRQEDNHWRDNLVKQVQHSELELIAHFADVSLRLSRILQLKPGDVLPIEKPDRIIAHVDGVPVLTSQYGTLNGQYALRVEHLINPILNSLNEEQPNE